MFYEVAAGIATSGAGYHLYLLSHTKTYCCHIRSCCLWVIVTNWENHLVQRWCPK